MGAEESPVGCTGHLLVATRGQDGPGEALIAIRGGSEAFTAWSQAPLEKGSHVLVVEERTDRSVDVVAWTDPMTEMP